jgi:peptidoglycan/LPS O-acetylase OafA/YrhL
LAHSWSLSVEEQFYLIYPFIFDKLFQWIRSKNVLLFAVILLACTFFRALNYSYPHISRMTGGPFFMNADFLLVGCVLRVVLPKYNDYLYRFSLYKYQILLISLVIGIIASIYEYLSGIQERMVKNGKRDVQRFELGNMISKLEKLYECQVRR